jgi:hypothetical protein
MSAISLIGAQRAERVDRLTRVDGLLFERWPDRKRRKAPSASHGAGNGAMRPQPADFIEIRKQLLMRGYKITPNRGKATVIARWSNPDYFTRELTDSGEGAVLENAGPDGFRMRCEKLNTHANPTTPPKTLHCALRLPAALAGREKARQALSAEMPLNPNGVEHEQLRRHPQPRSGYTRPPRARGFERRRISRQVDSSGHSCRPHANQGRNFY